MEKTERQMQRWIEANVTMNLDELSFEDAMAWHGLAEDDTGNFLKLAEYGFRLRRRRAHLPPPASRKEVVAFQLEFRLKIQLCHDRFSDLPQVPMFDFGGEVLVCCSAFRQLALLYGKSGGAA